MGYVLANIINLLCQYVFCCMIEVSGVKPFLDAYHVSILKNIVDNHNISFEMLATGALYNVNQVSAKNWSKPSLIYYHKTGHSTKPLLFALVLCIMVFYISSIITLFETIHFWVYACKFKVSAVFWNLIYIVMSLPWRRGREGCKMFIVKKLIDFKKYSR